MRPAALAWLTIVSKRSSGRRQYWCAVLGHAYRPFQSPPLPVPPPPPLARDVCPAELLWPTVAACLTSWSTACCAAAGSTPSRCAGDWDPGRVAAARRDCCGKDRCIDEPSLCGLATYKVLMCSAPCCRNPGFTPLLQEPFVELMKGSLNTFLNAFTYPDRTCYPVSPGAARHALAGPCLEPSGASQPAEAVLAS